MIVVVVADEDAMSGIGRESSGSAGGRTRRGPKRPNGPAWVANIGVGEDHRVGRAEQKGRVADERGDDGL